MTKGEYGFYKPTSPREIKDGIKSQSKSGSFAKRWWAQRWLDALENYNIGARLYRGRSYARKGQVISIKITKGTVRASVQGTRKAPYKVIIKVKTIPYSSWKKICEASSEEAIFAAKLLSGEMPLEMEDVFKDMGQTLFPAKYGDIQTECSCPDWVNPCKHIAAVYYLLGEEFDRDPFLIFRLRGMEPDSFLTMLNSAEGTYIRMRKSRCSQTEREIKKIRPQPISAEADLFWKGKRMGGDIFGKVIIPASSAQIPKTLGNFPYWRSDRHFQDIMNEIYKTASENGMDIFLAQFENKDA